MIEYLIRTYTNEGDVVLDNCIGSGTTAIAAIRTGRHYIGFEIEPFGGKEYAVRAVPANLFSVAKRELLMEMIDDLAEGNGSGTPDLINERVATMSCKAAVKGNHTLSFAEADKLIDELLELKNPYACPHGRPTIISMSKYELEKKFKRIV